jgi:hypothetical protein
MGAYDSVRRKVLYNILIDFGVPMKLVRLIKMCLNETYSKVRIGKHLSDSFPIQNDLKPGDALSPLNLLGDNIDTIKKNTETLIDASKEVGLEVNVEKTKYMLLSRHQSVGQIRDKKIANRSFENVSQFIYLGATVTNQNLIQEEFKRRLNSGNACYH